MEGFGDRPIPKFPKDIDIPVPPTKFEPTLEDITDAFIDSAAEEGWCFDENLGEHPLRPTNIRYTGKDGERTFEAFDRKWKLTIEEVTE